MNNLIALGLTLAGISAIFGVLSLWCRKVPMHQIGRFAGNEIARERYAHRLEAAGLGTVRNVRNAA